MSGGGTGDKKEIRKRCLKRKSMTLVRPPNWKMFSRVSCYLHLVNSETMECESHTVFYIPPLSVRVGRDSSVAPGGPLHKTVHIQIINHIFPGSIHLNYKSDFLIYHQCSFVCLKFEVSADVNINITLVSTIKIDLTSCLYYCQHHKLQDMPFTFKWASQNFH